MSDKEKLMKLFADLTVFSNPEKAARYFQAHHVTIRKYGKWRLTGDHFLPYQCSNCESKEEGRTQYCPNCGAEMYLEE